MLNFRYKTGIWIIVYLVRKLQSYGYYGKAKVMRYPFSFMTFTCKVSPGCFPKIYDYIHELSFVRFTSLSGSQMCRFMLSTLKMASHIKLWKHMHSHLVEIKQCLIPMTKNQNNSILALHLPKKDKQKSYSCRWSFIQFYIYFRV